MKGPFCILLASANFEYMQPERNCCCNILNSDSLADRNKCSVKTRSDSVSNFSYNFAINAIQKITETNRIIVNLL
jgi:hypothetical protein